MQEINEAVAILRSGGLVAFPTETVYGLGADAASLTAVKKVFAAKGRPFEHPLIVHIASAAELTHWAKNIPDAAMVLATAFWPGPLTMVLHKQAHVLDVVTGQQQTVALRIPNHPLALALLKQFGSGLVAPSANQFTHISPTNAAAVREELAHKIDMVLDGGDCQVGVESTIVDMTQAVPVILRPGMITADAIATALGMTSIAHAVKSKVRVAGQHAVHYAPLTKTHVLPLAALLEQVQKQHNVAVITYSVDVNLPHAVRLSSLPDRYAHDLYATLRALDHLQVNEILIEAVPDDRAWDAIRDRIMKASGDRE